MKLEKVICIIMALFLFGGCLTAHKSKSAKTKNIETYSLDLDNDTIPEVVEIEDRFAASADTFVKITKFKKKKAEPKVFDFIISGKFNKVEFAELGCDGFRQMLIYYDTAENFTHVSIYRLKNERLSQIFSASSNCDIETDFDTVPRVKIGKNIQGGKDCSVAAKSGEYETWLWDGEKFVRMQ